MSRRNKTDRDLNNNDTHIAYLQGNMGIVSRNYLKDQNSNLHLITAYMLCS